MGGAVHVPGNIPPGAAEFNIYVDPHAAEVVLGFPVPLQMVPLDVTASSEADADGRGAGIQGPCGQDFTLHR